MREKEENKKFRGGKLAEEKKKKKKKKNMARVSSVETNNRRCGNLTWMPLLKFGKLPASNVSSSSIVSGSLFRINKKK